LFYHSELEYRYGELLQAGSTVMIAEITTAPEYAVACRENEFEIGLISQICSLDADRSFGRLSPTTYPTAP
jgi:hypothetical protein